MIGHTWTGWDGSVFNLRRPFDAVTGITLLGVGGVEGMGTPKTQDFVRDNEILDGQEFQGWKAKPREVFWPVLIDGSDGSWLELQRAFWSSLAPGRYGVWRVTAPDGSWRELRCRYVEADDTYEVDPSEAGEEIRGVSLIADDPWWYGPTVDRVFDPMATAVPFFETSTTSSTVLNLMSAFTVARAQITNPGDEDAWPLWRIWGPVGTFGVGVGELTVAGTVAIPAGRYLTVNCDPQVQTVQWDDGTLVPFSVLSSVEFAPVPPGAQVDLFTSMDGLGLIEVSLDPRYRRAF